MIRLLLVYPQQMTDQGIAVALQDQPGIEVIGYVTGLAPALAYLAKQACDIVIASATLPNDGAIRLMQVVSEQKYPAKVMVTDLVDSSAVIVSYLERGVSGYMTEEETPDALIEKVHALQRGEFPVSPALGAVLIARVGVLKRLGNIEPGVSSRSPSLTLQKLTEREHEIFLLLADGYSNRRIAEQLVIEIGTTKSHVNRIMRKLNIQKRSQVNLFTNLLRD